MSEAPAVEINPVNQAYWDGLSEGELRYQQCACGHKWLPPLAECPRCLGNNIRWQVSSGRSSLVSWVVFHVAYHPYFKDRIPYNVALVELAEGPRMMTNVLDSPDGEGLVAGMELSLVIEKEQEYPIARFRRVSA